MSEIRVVAEGLGFTEGPLWHASDRLLVTSVSRGVIHVLDVLGEHGGSAFAETGGNPSGLAARGDTVWVAQGGRHGRTSSNRAVTPGIQRIAGQQVDDVVTTGQDAPNDCAFGPDGRLWFTDPRGTPMERTGPMGRICALDILSGEVATVVDGIRYPNGLAFTEDGAALLVAETGRSRILRFPIEGGQAGPSEVFASIPGHPDGMALDAAGRAHVAATTAHAVIVLDRSGAMVETVATGADSFPTNVCFGGCDGTTLFVTAARGGRVLACDRRVPGLGL